MNLLFDVVACLAAVVLMAGFWPLSYCHRWFHIGGRRKMRNAADNWLELAEKVRRYRRDQMGAAELAELAGRTEELRQRRREGSDAGALKLAIERLEEVLHRTGGAIYPKSSVAENVDFFLVAAIVILGVRAYFVQPFKIPTNSMWPTYYGMTPENFPPPGPAPSWPARIGRLLVFGAQRREAVAPRSGEVSAQFIVQGEGLSPLVMPYVVKPGHKWLVIPTQVLEYTFYVDGAPATVQVPLDFEDFDKVVLQTFFGDAAGFERHVEAVARSGPLRPEYFQQGGNLEGAEVVTLPLGRTVKAGDPIVRFDVMTGDQLFVDRFSYHFVRPKVGQGFVFRTDLIPHIRKNDYYIKRLVGVPGDVLEVRQPVLYRNGRPITGSEAFDWNAHRVGLYRGYFYGPPPSPPDILGLLRPGRTLQVPPGHYFAMGDNSLLSSDGRYWGFVPNEAVIGRPLFIYYPFTRRWGPAL